MEDILGGTFELLSGAWDLITGIWEWSPVEVIDTVAEFLPDGDATTRRPPRQGQGQPDDGMIDW